MACDGHAASAAGVWLEFRDAQGNTLGQAVLDDWSARPLPVVGDLVTCLAPTPDDPQRRLSGCVVRRQFDVQRNDDGAPCVWLYLVVGPQAVEPAVALPAVNFSRN